MSKCTGRVVTVNDQKISNHSKVCLLSISERGLACLGNYNILIILFSSALFSSIKSDLWENLPFLLVWNLLFPYGRSYQSDFRRQYHK